MAGSLPRQVVRNQLMDNHSTIPYLPAPGIESESLAAKKQTTEHGSEALSSKKSVA